MEKVADNLSKGRRVPNKNPLNRGHANFCSQPFPNKGPRFITDCLLISEPKLK
jgi:hypothetical protein